MSRSMDRTDSTSATFRPHGTSPTLDFAKLKIATRGYHHRADNVPEATTPPNTFQMRAEVPSFKPNSNAIRFLNADSTPDTSGPNDVQTSPVSGQTQRQTKPHNILQPIGTGPVPNGPGTASAKTAGLSFTTDGDPNFNITRFVVCRNIPHDWVACGTLRKALEECGIFGRSIACAVKGADEVTGTLYVWFDDLRDAAKSHETLAMILSTAESSFVSAHQYFEQDSQNPAARAISAYDGQVEFTANFTGQTTEFNLDVIRDVVREYADSLGQVRTFALQNSATIPFVHFRVEYYKLSAAASALQNGGIVKQIHRNFVVKVRDYLPTNYQRYAHPASEGRPGRMHDAVHEDPDQSESLTQVSPTKRSGYYPNPHTPGRIGPAISRPGCSANFYQSREYHESSRVASKQSPHTPSSSRFEDETPSRSMTWPSSSSGLGPLGRRGDILGQPQIVDVPKIEAGIDVRTTIMLRNIPNKMNSDDLKSIIDQTSLGQYDFTYLRVDFSNNCNVGYAFINFIRPEYIVPFVKSRVGEPWGIYQSQKIAEVSYATIQGQDCLVAKFRNSSVMREYPGFRPKVYYHIESQDITTDCKPGDEAPFPSPDNMTKLRRSLDNAQAVGLYPPRAGQSARDERRRRSQFDRGTPRAILDENAYDQVSPLTHRTYPSPRFPSSGLGSRIFSMPVSSTQAMNNNFQDMPGHGVPPRFGPSQTLHSSPPFAPPPYTPRGIHRMDDNDAMFGPDSFARETLFSPQHRQRLAHFEQ